MAGDYRLIGFLACYIAVFLMEIVRAVRKPASGYYRGTLLLTVLGLLLHTFYVSENCIFQGNRVVTNISGWFYLLDWGIVLCYLYFLYYYPKTPSGLFFLPIIFLLVAVAESVRQMNFPEAEAGRYIRGFHGIMFLLTCCCALSGCITGGMYFLQRRQLRYNKGVRRPVPLPSLEWLETANRRSIKLSVVFLGFGILSGFYINYRLRISSGSPIFSDPMIPGSVILFAIMTVFLSFVSFTRYFQGGKTIALFTIVCFLFLLSLVAIGVLSRHTHWYERSGMIPVPIQRETAVSGFPVYPTAGKESRES